MAKIILIAISVVIVATFSTMNQQEISLRYFFGWETVPFPLFLLILASLILGLIFGFLIGLGERWKVRTQARDLGKKVKVLREEIETLAKKPESPEPPLVPPEAEKTSIA
jgi:putative membrane protein